MTQTTKGAPGARASAANRGAKAPKPQRRSQEDRSRSARERLLRAAVAVLVRDGYGGLTMKEVAREAGLSSGALMHHYTNKGELVVAATAMIYEEALVRGQRSAQSPEAARAPVDGFIADCLSVYFDWPFVAALEIIVVARTDPELMERMLPVMEHYRVTCDAIWLAVFRKAGVPAKEARLALNLSLNIVRGMAINRLWRHDEPYYKAYLKEWTAIANAKLKEAMESGVKPR